MNEMMTKGKEALNKYQEFMKKYERIDQYLRSLFVLLLMMYVAGCFLRTTTYGAYSGSPIVSASYHLLFWILIIRIPFLFNYVNELNQALLFSAGLMVIHFFYPSSFMKTFAIILLGTIGIDFRRIMKAYVVTVGIGLSFTIFATFTEATNHLVYLVDGKLIRDSFGVCYPTDFASYVFFLLVFFWIAWERIPLWVSMVLGVISLFIVHVYAQSDTCTICCAAFLIVLLMLSIAPKFTAKKPQIKKYQWIVDLPLTFAFPLCAILMFAMIFLYAQGIPFFAKLNNMLTGRLQLANNAFSKYGVTLWGTAIKQAGNGFTTFPVSGYEFIDSSYPLILISMGLIFFLMMVYSNVRMSSLAIKRKDYRLAFGLGLIALHALSEHHFTEINYNLLMFLPYAVYKENDDEKDSLDISDNLDRKAFLTRNWKYLVSIAVVAIAMLLSPVWFSLVRTICGWRRFLNDEMELAWAFAGYGCILFIIIFAIKCILSKDKKRVLYGILTGGMLCLMVVGSCFLLTQAKKDTANVMNEDLALLKEIDGASSGSLYSTEFPWLYHKELKKLDFAVMTGDDLGRHKNATIIVPRGTEYYILLRLGFQYASLSDNVSIYSNDTAVLAKLQGMDITTHDYFDELIQVELPITTAESLYLRKGVYSVVFHMKVEKGDSEADEVAKLLIVGDSGLQFLYQDYVDKRELDEDGKAVRVVTLTLKEDMPAIRFYVMSENGSKIEVEGVSYQMTGNYKATQ